MTVRDRFTSRRGRLLTLLLFTLVIFAIAEAAARRHPSIMFELAAVFAFVTVLALFIAPFLMFRCPRCHRFISSDANILSPDSLLFRSHCNHCGFDLSTDEAGPR